MTINKILQLQPEYRDYVWGGARLRPGVSPTAEAWIVHEDDRVIAGSQAGSTLKDLSHEYGANLLGGRVIARTGDRFPLLIKLIDSAEWLSLQLHPSDEVAEKLEGAGHFGKTEAWYVVDARPGARLIAGLLPDTSQDDMEAAIRNGTIIDLARYLDVRTGETIFMPAGTLHSVGPGVLMYEVQQASDLTYRVYDWGRPQTEKRRLHIDQSLAAANPASWPIVTPPPILTDGQQQVLTVCRYFTLALLSAQTVAIQQNTSGETFHALTVIEGCAQIQAGNESLILEQFQTALIPAATGAYQVLPIKSYQMLKSSVEE